MVSLNDTAVAQLQISLKQDAAEAAFKARHSFGSSDAFKQIFDGIDKVAAPVKENNPEPKNEGPQRAHGHNHSHKSERKDDDKSLSKACDEDKATSENEVNKIAAPKHEKTKHVKKDKTDKTEEASDDKDGCKHTACTDKADASTEVKATVEAKASVDTGLVDLDVGVSAEAETHTCSSEENTANSDGSEQAATDVLADASTNTQEQAANTADQSKSAGVVIANLQLIAKEDLPTVHLEAVSKFQLQGLDFQKPVHDKAALQKTGKDDTTAAANDDFAAALDADGKLVKDQQGKDTQTDAKTERATQKEATQKHDDQLDLLQGKFSANSTPPAAGDRAISVALKASDSSAPTLNGSAGSGSPIAPKGDGANTALTGLAGLRPGHAADAASFAATLRGTKEAQASLMVPSEQIAVSLHRMAKSGTTQYELQLHPAELGRVDIKLDISKDGMVRATVSADNQQAFDMLQKDSKALERALQQAGLQTDDSSLSFNLRHNQNQAQQQQAQNQSGNAWNRWMDKTLPDEPAQSKVLTFDIAGANGRVDLRV
ncbi:MAG: flagellar hook-length control protein FliK [Alphaproteobacteria bacterium]|nr:flagellar hook-length control protein FliK [Alphaproteobacteria bacterium]